MTGKRILLVFVLVSVLVLLAREAWPAEAARDAPITYRATYRVEYRGRESGKAEISVRQHAVERRYEFTSVMRMTGAAKLLLPRSVTERSTFLYEGGHVIPLEFSYEDGREGDDNLQTIFDWQRGVAVTTSRTGTTELMVPAGTLDRGSLQVALMNDLEADAAPAAAYHVAVADHLQTYVFEIAETGVVATGVGPLNAQRFVQRREGTSRTLNLWMAPSLSFLPVQIEHQKNGETETNLVLESVAGMAAASAAP